MWKQCMVLVFQQQCSVRTWSGSLDNSGKLPGPTKVFQRFEQKVVQWHLLNVLVHRTENELPSNVSGTVASDGTRQVRAAAARQPCQDRTHSWNTSFLSYAFLSAHNLSFCSWCFYSIGCLLICSLRFSVCLQMRSFIFKDIGRWQKCSDHL